MSARRRMVPSISQPYCEQNGSTAGAVRHPLTSDKSIGGTTNELETIYTPTPPNAIYTPYDLILLAVELCEGRLGLLSTPRAPA